MRADAIHAYHDLLTDDLAVETHARLEQQTRQRGLYFGDRPVCTVLRPRFLTPWQYRQLQDKVRVLLSALRKVEAAARADATFRKQLRLVEWEEELVRLDPGFAASSPTARLDAFFVSANELKFTEYNAETPAGCGYNDVLADVFLGLPVMREFSRCWQVRPVPSRPGVLHALLDAYRQWAGTSEPPRIAILDWREVPTFSEFVIFMDYFQSQGLECVIADPREVEYRDGKLWAGDLQVNLLYKRVLVSELIDRGGLDHPVVRAVRDRAVCMVNPFRCKLLHKKASLAVLSDERNAPLFTPAEQEAIADHVPWTRVVEERQTGVRWQTAGVREHPEDLVPCILRNRERLVLKPNDEYGGKGIVLGWEVDDAAWELAVTAALKEPFIVQERVNLPAEPFPSLIDGRAQFIDRMLDTNPFVWYGDYMDGCLTRLSTAALLNVTAGGGSAVPTFLVEQRL